MNTISNDELAHHGIKGQRWGVRRFQNADGSLTSAGEKRYGDGGTGGSKSSNNNDSSGQQNLSAKEKKKAIKKFENDVANNWYKSYNKAGDVMTKELERINKNPKYTEEKLNDPNTYLDYLTEVDTAWKKCYDAQLRKDFGEYPDDDSEDWTNYVPMYGMYSTFEVETD